MYFNIIRSSNSLCKSMIQMMFLTVDYKLYYTSKPLRQEYDLNTVIYKKFHQKMTTIDIDV